MYISQGSSLVLQLLTSWWPTSQTVNSPHASTDVEFRWAIPTLAIKPGGDITRNPKQGYQKLYKKRQSPKQNTKVQTLLLEVSRNCKPACGLSQTIGFKFAWPSSLWLIAWNNSDWQKMVRPITEYLLKRHQNEAIRSYQCYQKPLQKNLLIWRTSTVFVSFTTLNNDISGCRWRWKIWNKW